MTTKRQLAAIMFTDITGYSAMMQADEDYARRIRQRHRSVFKEAHDRHHGTILQYYGDGTLSIFDSAAAAVECAVDMQIEYRKEPEVPLRIGIHTGDISWDDEGAYGDGLNIASRVEKLAIPGSVFITAKVFDDIKNHKWLTAISLGLFRLHNINRPLEVYSITCKGVDYPTLDEILEYPELLENHQAKEEEREREESVVGAKKKSVAAIIAFFFGWSGIHRLYLGKRASGIFWLISFFLAVMITASESNWEFPPAAIFPIIGFIDFILLAAMPRVEFDQKYNKIKGAPKRKSKRKTRRTRKTARKSAATRKSVTARRWRDQAEHVRSRTASPPPESKLRVRNPALAQGVKLYKAGIYDEAIVEFEEAIRLDPTLTAAYFNLACCYAMMKDHKNAYRSLASAVDYGFRDFHKIKSHQALAYLRNHEDYQTFVANNYKVIEQLPEPKPDVLSELQDFNPLILDKLEDLGELLDKGELTREQFEQEKRKILGHE